MSKRILITGGAGFIGSSLAQKLADNPANYIVIVDNLLTGSETKLPQSVHSNVKFIRADVNDFQQIIL